MRRHALLIGIDRYPHLMGRDLRGCRNDVEAMRATLIDRYRFAAGDVETLLDGEATRAGILDALERFATRVGEGEVAVLYYAGHGSRMRDPADPDERIESLVASDSGRGDAPNRDVIDREIDRWVQRLNRTTPFVTLLFDCCHSGSVTRDAFGPATREVPPDERSIGAMFGGDRPPAALAADADRGRHDGQAGWLPGRRSAVLVAACRATEKAGEHLADDGPEPLHHGLLTYLLVRELGRVRGATSWRALLERIAPELTSLRASQHPQLEGKADEQLFGVADVRPAPYLLVSRVDGDTVELAGGAAHGVTRGSRWSVMPHGSRRDGRPGKELAEVTIEAVRAARSVARRTPAGGRDAAAGEGLGPGQRAFLRELRVASPALRVWLDPAPDHAGERGRLRVALEAQPLVALVADERDADVRVRRLEARPAAAEPFAALGALPEPLWIAVGADGALAVRARGAAPGAAGKLATDLAGLARYRNLLRVDNPDPAGTLHDAVTLRVLRPAGDGGWAPATPAGGDGLVELVDGERVEIEVASRRDEPLVVTLVQFGVDHAIDLLMPAPNHATYRAGGYPLPPGGSVRLGEGYFARDPKFAAYVDGGIPMHLPDAFPFAADSGVVVDRGVLTLRLLVTRRRADFAFLRQRATRAASPPLGSHPLEQLVALFDRGTGTRSLVPRAAVDPDADWAAVTLPLAVRRR